MTFNSVVKIKPIQLSTKHPKPHTLMEWDGSTEEYFSDLHINPANIKKQTRLIVASNFKGFRLPDKNEQLRIRTQGQINLATIILKFVETQNIKELTVATYTFNRETLHIVQDLFHSGQIERFTLLVSNSYKFRDRKYSVELSAALLKLSKMYDVHMAYINSHTKISLFHTDVGFYVQEGSMNYSTNNWIEQLLLEENQAQYKHDYEFLQNVVPDENSKGTEIIC